MKGACRPVASGVVALVVLVAGFGGWAVTAEIRSAIIAPGRVEVAGGRQTIQHQDGGIVSALFVTEGEVVAEGQVLMRLDDTALTPEFANVAAQLLELGARRARLVAERDGTARLIFDDALTTSTNPLAAEVMASQRALFTARTEAAAQQIAQLHQQQASARDQISGLREEGRALARQRELIEQELLAQQSLLERGLAQSTRVLALERELATLDGRQAALGAARAQADGWIAEATLQISELAASRRAEAGMRLRDLDLAMTELAARHQILSDQIEALTIRAPVAGIVWGLQVARVPAVLRPAEAAMHILPEGSPLIVTAETRPEDIDQINPGAPVHLRLTASDRQRMPELWGTISRVSADAFTDPASGMSFYRVEIAFEDVHADTISLIPGMPVEAFITTGAQSPARWLLRPLSDYFNRALRDG